MVDIKETSTPKMARKNLAFIRQGAERRRKELFSEELVRRSAAPRALAMPAREQGGAERNVCVRKREVILD